MTDPNKPKRRYWFLTPAMVEAWEQGVRRRLRERAVGTAVAALAMLALLAIFSPLLKRWIPPTPKQTAAAPPTATGQDPDIVFNSFLQSIVDTRNQYEAKKAAEIGRMADLYSASSFSNRRDADRLIQAVTDLVELDRQYDQAVHELPKKALAAANKAGVEMSARVSMTFRFQMKLAGFLTALDAFQAAEDEWARDTVELYRFTRKHAGSIVTVHDQVTIADRQIRSRFNTQLATCLSAYAKVQAADAKLHAIQKPSTQESATTQTGGGAHAP